MKGVIFPGAVVLLILVHSSQPVYVQDGEFQFPLESVKKLKELFDEDARTSSHMRGRPHFTSVCTNPDLPKEFQPVCQKEDGPLIFNRLKLVVQDMDLCEICTNAACAGCL
uniref:Guanylate cyclase activator 2B n=1 Tax=Pelusios castaneus TaxID=367368 RepID=A0A8C8SF15_9SAUR